MASIDWQEVDSFTREKWRNESELRGNSGTTKAERGRERDQLWRAEMLDG